MSVYTTVPPAVVAAVVAANPVTREELNQIRDPRDPFRLMGVYAHVHGRRYSHSSYRARVLKFFELGSSFESQEAAGRAVVAFYKAHYGARWARVFRHRKVTPWRLRQIRCKGKVMGYAADVYVRGRPVGITAAAAFGRSPGAHEIWVWPTERAAKEAARAAMERIYKKELPALALPHRGLLFWRG